MSTGPCSYTSSPSRCCSTCRCPTCSNSGRCCSTCSCSNRSRRTNCSCSVRATCLHTSFCSSNSSWSAQRPNPARYSHLHQVPAWQHQIGWDCQDFARYITETMKQQVDWHWPPSDVDDDSALPDFVETCFCPCLVYSRTLARLNAAFAGQDPQRIPNANFVDLNSCNFMLCLPCWYSIRC